MALETGTYINSLVATNPVVGDDVAQGDDHLRLIKATLLATFPNVTGAVTPTHTELNYVDGVTSAIQTQLDAKAATASPALTGTPTVPTAAGGTNTTQAASTAFVTAAVAAVAVPSGCFVLLKSTPISGTPTSVDFVNGTGGAVISSTYDEYLITLSSVKPSTDGVSLMFRTSTDAGVSYSASAGDYKYTERIYTGGSGADASDGGTATHIQIASTIGNAAGEEGVSGQLTFWAPSAATPLMVQFNTAHRESTAGAAQGVIGTGFRVTAADVDAVRIMFSSGTMASGTIKLFGRKL